MARSALLIGGTGKTGSVLARRLLETGWSVTLGSRGERPVPDGLHHVRLERDDTDAVRKALGGGVDVLVDFVAFEVEHARQLLGLHGLARSLVVVSSAAVYAEPFAVPITERHRTVAAGDATYAAKKAAVERTLLEHDVPATIIRAGAIYGPGDTGSREWHFVKRALDGRRVVVFAHRGESRFQPTSVHNLAELMRLAAERPGRRVLNCGDPQAPTVVQIGRAIAAAMEHEWAEVLLAGPPRDDVIGENPWGTPRPFVLDMTEAEFELGYRPVTTYEKAVPETCAWLVEATRGRDWREVLPRLVEHDGRLFDYDAEDRFLRGLTGG